MLPHIPLMISGFLEMSSSLPSLTRYAPFQEIAAVMTLLLHTCYFGMHFSASLDAFADAIHTQLAVYAFSFSPVQS